MDVCDACPEDFDNDIDGDGICGDVDNCVNTANTDQSDIDSDELEMCVTTVLTENTDQADVDSDGTGDACDDCPNDPDNDIDGIPFVEM